MVNEDNFPLMKFTFSFLFNFSGFHFLSFQPVKFNILLGKKAGPLGESLIW